MNRLRLGASTIGLSLSLLSACAYAAPSDASAILSDDSNPVAPVITLETIDFESAVDTTGDNQDLVVTEIELLPLEDQPGDLFIDSPSIIDPINTEVPRDTATDGGTNVILLNEDPASVDGPWVVEFNDMNAGSDDIRYTTVGSSEDLISMVNASADPGLSPIAVPLPAAFSVGLLTMAGAGFYLRYKRI